MPITIFSSWAAGLTVLALFLILPLIALIRVPGCASGVAEAIHGLRDGLSHLATALFHHIRNIWRLADEKAKQQKRLEQRACAEVERMASEYHRPLTSDETRATRQHVLARDGEPRDPSSLVIVSAWMRRFIYLALVLICLVSVYALTSFGMPALFDVKPLLPHLRFFFGLPLAIIPWSLFASTAVLSSMLIEEYTRRFPTAVRIDPDITRLQKRIKLGFSILMFVMDIIVVVSFRAVFLSGAKSSNLELITFLHVPLVYLILIGTAIMLSLGIVLAWPGAIEGSVVCWLMIGSLIALLCMLIRLVLAVASALLMRLDSRLNTALARRSNRAPHPKGERKAMR